MILKLSCPLETLPVRFPVSEKPFIIKIRSLKLTYPFEFVLAIFTFIAH